MQPAGEDRIREIFEEVAKGSNLDRALALIADHTAAHLGAPTCKVWVVKRGDICERCPLANVCSNRQMCMHLVAASGAVIEKEYPRIPLSVFSATMIARGGASDFNDSSGVGEKLFGLQHGAQSENRDSYALYPLRGASGTVGLIGIFNHRPIAQLELRWLAQLAPAAVAAVRVAELQSRSEGLRMRLEKEIGQAEKAKSLAATRETELEDAVAQLTLQVAQLQVEREPLVRAREEAIAKVQELTEANQQFEQSSQSLEAQNRELRAQAESLLGVQQQSGRAYSEMAAQLESERRRIEEENSWLKGRLETREQNFAEQSRERESLASNLAERTRENKSLAAQLEAVQSELASARETIPRLQERLVIIEETNKGLRDHNSAITESVDDLERSLRIAEDARARLEQTRVVLEQQVERSADEVARLRVEKERVGGENEQLVTETERLRQELVDLRATLNQVEDERNRAIAQENELAQARSEAEARARRSETENAALWRANSGLEDAVKQFQQLTARLEDSASKLKDRSEANDHARSELEQQLRNLTEKNRRITLETQAQARFMANMSHELRTPMNAIIGFTSLLLDDRSLHMTDRHRRSLERVSRNARDLLELINNVLDLSKIDAGRMDVYSEPADVRDLIERAIGVVEPLKENRPIRLLIEVEENLPTMRTDRIKLQQILINLLSNAIKFTREGEVKVTAERSGSEAIRIAISDTGIGLSVTDFPKLFQEFQQFGGQDQLKQGSGLGLAITRRLVELLGGEITVSSKPAEGSVFAIVLPTEIEGRVAEAAELEALPADPGRTALVLDVDPASLYLIKKYLGEVGYSVAATDDAERGLEIAQIAKPSVITIDLDLLDDAVGIVRKIAGGKPESQIIVISSETQLEQTAKEAGASAFLHKPVERSDLLRLLERGSAQSQASANVLVVDDDQDTRDLVVEMLDGGGYQLRTATHGREALDEIERSRPDVIILDLMLPEMDGFEVIHRLSLNSDWRHIPVILLTARDLSHEERRALDIGTSRILQKGNFSRDELLAELRSLVFGQGSEVGGQRTALRSNGLARNTP